MEIQKMNIYNETKMIMNKYNLDFKKKFGQNFLISEEILDETIANANICSEDVVLEIGPGIGTLTAKLLETGAEVISVEVDEDLLKPLKDRFFLYGNFTLISSDILKVDIVKEIRNILSKKGKEEKKVKVVANIPYYITTPIIFKLIESREMISEIYIMVQKEVAERLIAKTGGKDSSAITYYTSYYTENIWNIFVGKENFMPAPKVDSMVVGLKLRKNVFPEVLDEEKYFKLIRSGFLHRRKTFLNSIQISKEFDIQKITGILEELGIDKRIRPEKITDEQYAQIVNMYIGEKYGKKEE